MKWIAVLLAMASPAGAQEWADGAPDIPRFEQCLPEQMALFEERMFGLPGYGVTVPMDAFNVHWVQHCGYLAMGICEVSSNGMACQRRLREAFERRTDEMLALLPWDVAGELSPLYEQVYQLAVGTNAGDDCAGESYRRQLWCASFMQVLKFEEAVWAWQIARLAGAAGPVDWDALSRVE